MISNITGYKEKRTRHFGFKKKAFCVYIALSLVFTFFQCTFMFDYYDYSSGVFSDSRYIRTTYWFLALTALSAVALALYIGKNNFHRHALNDSLPLSMSASACIIAFVVYLLLDIMSRGVTGRSVIENAVLLCGLFSCLYFGKIVLGNSKSRSYGKALAVCGFFLILFFIFVLLSGYFGIETSYNNPVWNLQNFALIATMLYFLSEIRFWLKVQMPMVNYALAVISVLLSIPAFAGAWMCLGNTMDSYSSMELIYHSRDFITMALNLVLNVYISVRVFDR